MASTYTLVEISEAVKTVMAIEAYMVASQATDGRWITITDTDIKLGAVGFGTYADAIKALTDLAALIPDNDKRIALLRSVMCATSVRIVHSGGAGVSVKTYVSED